MTDKETIEKAKEEGVKRIAPYFGSYESLSKTHSHQHKLKDVNEWATERALQLQRDELRQKIDVEIEGYVHKRDGWNPDSKEFAAYDLAIRVLEKVLQLFKTP